MGKGRGKGREAEGAIKCGGCVFGSVFLLVIILISASFSKLEYYEYGFAKRLTTSTVDRSKVYGAGNHLLGPDYSFVTFPANVISVEQDDLSAWTRADAGTASSTGSAGTSVIIDVSYVSGATRGAKRGARIRAFLCVFFWGGGAARERTRGWVKEGGAVRPGGGSRSSVDMRRQRDATPAPPSTWERYRGTLLILICSPFAPPLPLSPCPPPPLCPSAPLPQVPVPPH
jgi:hypothetical protein